MTEIIDVVSITRWGSGSYYLLVPMSLKERLHIPDGAQFVVMLDNNKIVYQRKDGKKAAEDTPQ